MNLQKIALKKGKEVAAHNIQSWTRRTRYDGSCIEHESRSYATDNGPKDQLKGGPALVKGDIATSQNKHQHQQRYKSIDRDFFLSVLGSSATKRDARSYLKTFTPAPNAKTPSQKPAPSLANIKPQGYGVNLGEFYGRTRAVANSPKFVQPSGKEETKAIEPPLHVALVKIRDPQNLDDNTLSGIGRTLSQLGHLGLTSVVVVDCNDTSLPLDRQNKGWRVLATQQADRVVAAIDAHGRPGARLVDNIIGVSENDVLESTWLKGRTHVSYRKLLMTPLRRGLIPVLPCIGYTEATPTAISLEANDVVLALTRELTGLRPSLKPDEDPIKYHEQLQALQNEVSVDRLIVIDPLGGVPTSERPNGYHVFLNMEQEFQSAKQDLLRLSKLAKDNSQVENQTRGESLSDLAANNPLSGFVEAEFCNVQQSNKSGETAVGNQLSTEYNHHLDNLELVRKVLTILPRTSSALLTTPDEAANSGRIPDRPFQATGVGTRRQRNPLIHNLLTDKPAFSSSLPVGRLGPSTQSMKQEPHPLAKSITPTTFAKHGMSISIYPDPNISPWEPPTPGISPLSLTDSQIDLPRLVHLIEDSFDRKLDVEHFLKRVNGRIAGVIIAGEYEGGALLTWELPPGVPDDGSPESRARMVPYLDKFAVLKRSQGSGGVADIVFTAMVRDCFPNGVCWRSRKNNPVNKWYFERSRGTWKLAVSNWAMFWTTSNMDLSKQMFLDYEGVCRGVVPSWADPKAVAD